NINASLSGSVINITAKGDWYGVAMVTVTAGDGEYNATNITTVTVYNVNDAPIFTSTPIYFVNDNETYIYDANATDIEGDNLTYSLISPPSGANINSSTGVMTWSPAKSQTGNFTITILVDDGNGGNTTQCYNLSVIDVTEPVVSIIEPENITYTTVNIPLSFTVDETANISYTLDGGSNISATNNTIITVITDGLHNITLYANDSAGLIGVSSTRYFTVSTSSQIYGNVTSGGSPLSGASVTVKYGASIINSTTTAADGSYNVVVAAGTYDVVITKSGYIDNVTTGITVTSGTPYNLNASLTVVSTTGTLSGYIKDSNNTIYGAIVTLKLGASTVNSTTSDESGYYTVSANAGTYNITIVKTGYDTSTTNDYSLALGNTELNFTIMPSSSGVGSVSGTVYENVTFSSVGGATVLVYKTGTSDLVQVVNSDGSGNFIVNGLPQTDAYDFSAYNSTHSSTVNQTNVAVPTSGLSLVIG
ncbi:hypothetical protein DRJ17_03660, partial [Candidatus Woesearchaeota archaeon]